MRKGKFKHENEETCQLNFDTWWNAPENYESICKHLAGNKLMEN